MDFGKIALKLARSALESHLTGKTLFKQDDLPPEFKEKRGLFVTLKKGEELRGCIGQLEGHFPLYKTIQEMAIASAFSDSRFLPLTREELCQIKIEISVLTPLQKVENLNEIVIGRHGLLIRKGLNSGVFLPQVPVEWDWELDEYLFQLCLKAGLPPNSHLAVGSELYSFCATIYSEV